MSRRDQKAWILLAVAFVVVIVIGYFASHTTLAVFCTHSTAECHFIEHSSLSKSQAESLWNVVGNG